MTLRNRSDLCYDRMMSSMDDESQKDRQQFKAHTDKLDAHRRFTGVHPTFECANCGGSWHHVNVPYPLRRCSIYRQPLPDIGLPYFIKTSATVVPSSSSTAVEMSHQLWLDVKDPLRTLQDIDDLILNHGADVNTVIGILPNFVFA
jgi:hypothetical protein